MVAGMASNVHVTPGNPQRTLVEHGTKARHSVRHLLRRHGRFPSPRERTGVAATERAEEAEAKNKKYEHEIDSLKTENEGLQKKVQMLEEELDNTKNDLKDAVEKYATGEFGISDALHTDLNDLQDGQEKYRESKRELDELVAGMEGL
ncbi:hypothetical protein NUW54_g5913 [Trametes sanguinea]|uniref:Uncharacterized protein n=1 Tax=Trametes sanguinea TaxID=158606 RepID=A0ACC1PVE2_9APHY|nr:hypothetical protein NUW54_g5913 [Trametes sanguinea]